MRESLSLFRLYHWKKSFWNGHYKQLIEWWGWDKIYKDSIDDILGLAKKIFA